MRKLNKIITTAAMVAAILAGTAPDPVEIAEETLCTALFHTFDGWKSPKNGGLSVKRGEKAVIRCKLWKYKDSPKPEDLPADADPLTRAAAEQGGGDYYMTTAYLFGRWQVEKREPKKPTESAPGKSSSVNGWPSFAIRSRTACKIYPCRLCPATAAAARIAAPSGLSGQTVMRSHFALYLSLLRLFASDTGILLPLAYLLNII